MTLQFHNWYFGSGAASNGNGPDNSRRRIRSIARWQRGPDGVLECRWLCPQSRR